RSSTARPRRRTRRAAGRRATAESGAWGPPLSVYRAQGLRRDEHVVVGPAAVVGDFLPEAAGPQAYLDLPHRRREHKRPAIGTGRVQPRVDALGDVLPERDRAAAGVVEELHAVEPARLIGPRPRALRQARAVGNADRIP